ncbi:glycosyltransferase family 2 protein [Patescibacteria group bacterium]|nr:glycosyltransferase family 2 protein [Patescibacteria group bacterium]
MKSLITIVIPVYNRVHLLPLVLGSIKKQTYKNIEIIIIDDGSTEDMENIISYFKNSFPITYIRQENKGAPSARNRGLEEAKGEYVIFWDADVIGRPNMLEKMYGVLQENSEASYAYSNFQFSIYNLQTILNYSIFKKKIPAREFNLDELKKNNFIHSTSLIRMKDVIRWDESIKRFQDWDLWLTMSEDGKKGVWVDEYLFTVLGGGTMSGWLPGFAYKTPFKWLPWVKSKVFNYEKTKKIVLKKHNLYVND